MNVPNIYFIRLDRRNLVQMKPKLSDKEENAAIISEFEQFLKGCKVDAADSNSTIRKCMGHLFLYEDLMLSYLSEKIPGYDLGSHLDPAPPSV